MKRTRIAITMLSLCVCASCFVPAVRADDMSSAAVFTDPSTTDTGTVDLAAQYPDEFTVITPSSITSLPDGGISYNYAMEDGTTCSTLVPPKNFKPLTATDDQLKQYGFPTRPTDPTQLTQWTADMKAWKGSVNTKKLFKKKNTVLNSHQKLAGAQGTDFGGYYWSGVVDYPATSGTYSGGFRHVEGFYTMPTKKDGTAITNECSWVGIGGAKSAKLLQCGTWMDTKNGKAHYWDFYEWLVYCVI